MLDFPNSKIRAKSNCENHLSTQNHTNKQSDNTMSWQGREETDTFTYC